MTYVVLTKHLSGNSEVEHCRVDTEASAKAVAAKLAKEKFSDKLPDGGHTKPVLRYASVRVQKVGG